MQETQKTQSQIVDIKIPVVGESISEVTISKWLVKDGDMVKIDQIVAEIESDKATFEITASHSGKCIIKAEAGVSLEIGALVCQIDTSFASNQTSTTAIPTPSKNPKKEEVPSNNSSIIGHPSPAAHKILAEKGIQPSTIKGTGIGGRITKEDAVSTMTKASTPATVQATPSNTTREQRREKMSSLRKTISRRLVAVKNETAMLTTFNEINMKPIMDIRKEYKDAFKEKYDVGLGFMSFFTKAVCAALKEYPAVNAQIDGDEIIYNDFCDISIAVSAPKGLVVPVIRNADILSFSQIEKEILQLAQKARENKLSIEEMTGGTFTITNGGIFGSLMSTPIINGPQSAILGMHNIVERPVVCPYSKEIVARPMMYVALSYDHRIIDGRESVSFLVRVKQLLEDPTRLLLEV